MPKKVKTAKVSKKNSNLNSHNVSMNHTTEMLGDGHVFFKHNKMINLKS